jgi:hypothetical protein
MQLLVAVPKEGADILVRSPFVLSLQLRLLTTVSARRGRNIE